MGVQINVGGGVLPTFPMPDNRTDTSEGSGAGIAPTIPSMHMAKRSICWSCNMVGDSQLFEQFSGLAFVVDWIPDTNLMSCADVSPAVKYAFL